MTATDELRKLLDQRGVEWWEADDSDVLLHTLWRNEGGQLATYFEPNGDSADGFMREVCLYDCAPEQAIAATLGSHEQTCEIYRVGNTQDWRKCSACNGLMCFDHPLDRDHLNYCPNCGAKVVNK